MTFSAYSHAQTAPAPAPAPDRPVPRVPFTAFRMKPILEPRLQAEQAATPEGSLIIPDDEKPKRIIEVKKTMPVPAVAEPAPAIITPPRPVVTQQLKLVPTPNGTKVLGVLPVAKPKPAVPATVEIQNAEQKDDKATPDDMILSNGPSDYVSRVSGLPIPPRKPGTENDAPNLLERLTNTDEPATIEPPLPVGATEVPVPPEQDETAFVPPVPEAAPDLGLAPGRSTRVRIRDADRFSSQGRTAGLSLGGGNDSADLPDELRNVRIGRIEEADGLSPIVIPGLRQASIPRSPEIPRNENQKLPSEVIVFFEENSDSFEVGQMEVLKADVVNLLQERPDLDLEIVGYADAPGGNKDSAKNLSEARALTVREYLIRQKIPGKRLKVTAKANNTKIEPRDRADLFFVR